jgi:hypothetical protein
VLKSNVLSFKVKDKGSVEFLTIFDCPVEIRHRAEIQFPSVYLVGMPRGDEGIESVDIVFTDGTQRVQFNLGVDSARLLGAALTAYSATTHVQAEDPKSYEPPLMD